jgi:acyl carrier protein
MEVGNRYMETLTREQIFYDVRHLLDELKGDWDYEEEITHETRLFADLGFESIDAVALAAAIEEHYQRHLPFAEYLADLVQKEVPDITVDDIVSFTYMHLGASSVVEGVQR